MPSAAQIFWLAGRLALALLLAGHWEYLLEDAIFTAPPVPAWSGAVLIAPDGKLAEIGSLIVGDADRGFPGNVFVPIHGLRPVMGE